MSVLHVRRVMTALENAVFSLNDAEVFVEYSMNLGERHKACTVRLEHFDVCIILRRSRLLRGTFFYLKFLTLTVKVGKDKNKIMLRRPNIDSKLKPLTVQQRRD